MSESNLKGPRIKTIKRLFAYSKNQCAFPTCEALLISEEGTVIGEICHIKAKSEGGLRYDSNQTDEERHSFDNLILLCPSHHTIIDDLLNGYTVEKLCTMKKEHEANGDKVKKCSKEIAKEFIRKIKITNVTNIQITNNYNYSKEVFKSLKVIVMKITHYQVQLKEVKRRNRSAYELVPISYSDEEIIEALAGVDEELVLNVLSFVDETRLLSQLLIERAEFCKAKGFIEGMPILHVGLNSIDRNIERTFDKLTDKRNFKMAQGLQNYIKLYLDK